MNENEDRPTTQAPPWHGKWQGGVAKAKLDVLEALEGYPRPVQKKALSDMANRRVNDEARADFEQLYEQGDLDDFEPNNDD